MFKCVFCLLVILLFVVDVILSIRIMTTCKQLKEREKLKEEIPKLIYTNKIVVSSKLNISGDYTGYIDRFTEKLYTDSKIPIGLVYDEQYEKFDRSHSKFDKFKWIGVIKNSKIVVCIFTENEVINVNDILNKLKTWTF